jgi:hypothetical protein
MADQIVHVTVDAGNEKLQDEHCMHIVGQIQGEVCKSLFMRIGSVIERDYPRMTLGQLSINVTRDGPSAIASIGDDQTMRIRSVEKAIENILVREAYEQAIDESPATHCWECLEEEPDAADMAMWRALEDELIEEGYPV